jgi:hypothetical protein
LGLVEGGEVEKEGMVNCTDLLRVWKIELLSFYSLHNLIIILLPLLIHSALYMKAIHNEYQKLKKTHKSKKAKAKIIIFLLHTTVYILS